MQTVFYAPARDNDIVDDDDVMFVGAFSSATQSASLFGVCCRYCAPATGGVRHRALSLPPSSKRMHTSPQWRGGACEAR